MTKYVQSAWKQLLVVMLGSLILLSAAGCGSGSGDAGQQGQPRELQLSLLTEPAPPEAGPVTLIVEVKDNQGKSVDGAKVSLLARHVNMTHGGIEGDLVEQGSGRYQAAGSFSMSGTWRAEVQVEKADFPAKKQTFELAVR